ncbi:hypothetical protein [Yoonia sp. I 8.24]|uniref:hypothetical protein n=1 Tax=Yoonia sp. I 8.24 TaxID=1537229 RepID=UPI001EDCFD8C|nr:hypothetical protein [Yoonia sp. I 8.24]MCG3266824.1 hypothetical protein [Yoonia sp. I 8.24]
MRLLVTVISTILCAAPLCAGPWAREKGQLFFASGGSFVLSEDPNAPVNFDPTFYGEYGLNGTVTLGIDYYATVLEGTQSAIAFASFPIGQPAGNNVFGAQLGLGGRMDAFGGIEYLTRGGVSWGRGLDRGWLTVDTSATYGTIDQAWLAKADLTWGHHFNDHWTVMAQLQTGQGGDDDTYAKINPAVVFHINDHTSISLGAVQTLTNDQDTAIRVDIWTTATIPRFRAEE